MEIKVGVPARRQNQRCFGEINLERAYVSAECGVDPAGNSRDAGEEGGAGGGTPENETVERIICVCIGTAVKDENSIDEVTELFGSLPEHGGICLLVELNVIVVVIVPVEVNVVVVVVVVAVKVVVEVVGEVAEVVEGEVEIVNGCPMVLPFFG